MSSKQWTFVCLSLEIKMSEPSHPLDAPLLMACNDFWNKYYRSMALLHLAKNRAETEPIQDRNLGTTDAAHVSFLEQFWSNQLAAAIGVPASEVGKRKISFRSHRSKSFDVCWPRKGDPKILISIKSMQNAFRNLTNRIEEAIGDSAVLRLYKKKAAFGFFFFIVDGRVSRGLAEQGKKEVGEIGYRRQPPMLDLIEEGGDFFDLSNVEHYRKPAGTATGKRQDDIEKAEKTLLDMVVEVPKKNTSIHYDAIAFTPVRIKRTADPMQVDNAWEYSFSSVHPLLESRRLLDRLIATAKLRRFL